MTVTRERFNYLITEEIRRLAPAGTEVSVHRIPKNNGIVLDAVTIMPKGLNIAPSIYLESYFREFCAGTPASELAEELISESGEYMLPSASVDPEDVTGFDTVRGCLRYRVVNYGMNSGMLKTMPHERILDLAKIYYYVVDVEGIENASALVSYKDLARWGVTEEELARIADVNTPLQEPARLDSVRNVIRDLLSGHSGDCGDDLLSAEELLPPDDFTPIYVLTNRSRVFGAACFLYDGVLEKAAAGMESDLFVLPSSIHELIVLPDMGQFTGEELEDMVSSINAEHVLPTEVLSDHAYRYRWREAALETAVTEKRGEEI